MVLALIVVLILSLSFSVCLFLFLGKNAIKNENDTILLFDKEKLSPLRKKNVDLDIEVKSYLTTINSKTTEFTDIEKKKKELDEQLKVAESEAKKRENKLKPTSLETLAENLPSDPILERKVVQNVIDSDKKNADIINSLKDTKFDEKTFKNNAIRLNDELKTFLSNKEKEAMNNPNFKATYGRNWVLTVNDLKNKGKESVFSGLDIKNVSDKPKSLKGMESLKNLLLQTKVQELNYYFAFDYFPHHKPTFEGFISNLKIEMVVIPDKDDKKNKATLSSKQDEFKRYVKKYGEEIRKLNSYDDDPKKNMATIEEIKKHFLWYDKAFLELLKKDNK